LNLPFLRPRVKHKIGNGTVEEEGQPKQKSIAPGARDVAELGAKKRALRRVPISV
jgi:hypothetical protein